MISALRGLVLSVSGGTVVLDVHGVGPKSALGVLAELTPDEVALAVTAEDDTVFKRVSGIGPKTAKLIIVSLAGKLMLRPAPSPTPSRGGADARVRVDVERALVGLGWAERSAAAAVDEVLERASVAESTDVQALLRLALGVLGGARPAGDRA